MRIVRSIRKITGKKKVVLTIGNFDGLHKGHQKIIDRLVQDAREADAHSCVITFATHPRKVIFHRKAVGLLHALGYKLMTLRERGVDRCCLLPFDEHVRSMASDVFLKKYIPSDGVLKVIVGHDFHFGNKRSGTVNDIRRYCRHYGIRFEQIPAVKIAQRPVSSNRIRTHVREGEIAEATACLGRPYPVVGIVRKGTATGRQIGFPTANVTLGTEVVPPDGVYVVRVRVLRKRIDNSFSYASKKAYLGLAYKGPQPAFLKKQHDRTVIEVYVLGYRGDLYGTYLEVSFLSYMRKPKRVDDIAALKALITQDISLYEKNANKIQKRN